MNYYVGVDVGTGSARAALFNENGKLIKTATNVIKTFNYSSVYYEQSSDDIWNSVKKVVKVVNFLFIILKFQYLLSSILYYSIGSCW